MCSFSYLLEFPIFHTTIHLDELAGNVRFTSHSFLVDRERLLTLALTLASQGTVPCRACSNDKATAIASSTFCDEVPESCVNQESAGYGFETRAMPLEGRYACHDLGGATDLQFLTSPMPSYI